VTDWTVDYGDGPRAIQVPHSWRQDVPVTWEGPAVYRTVLATVKQGQHLLFEGVSYEAIVRANGVDVGEHRGIWDAFSVPLPAGANVQIEVEVRKNGGATFPVKDVASGFLPFVFHTFGGIYKSVSTVDGPVDLGLSIGDFERVSADGVRLVGPQLTAKQSAAEKAADWIRQRKGETIDQAQTTVHNRPLYFRGILTWGWYPDLGHCNPPDDVIHREIEIIKNLGFTLVKFCQWVPSHR